MLRDLARLRFGFLAGALLASSLAAPALGAQLAVDVWTDRSEGAVYQPGESIEISARTSEDAFLLVYEIDAEGGVRVLYPHGTRTPFVEGHTTLRLPGENEDERLVIEGPVGQGYVVAIASRDPFKDLPWYLRPYDPHAEALGYQTGGTAPGSPAGRDSGVTSDGHIVGDPFVAMERIRRQVLGDPTDPESFATAYASYYVHHAVQYPRYLCNDCHRPGYWSWWDGFDPYYTTCSAFTFHVNVGWWWGPSYWFGCVPYYVYAYRPGCSPRYYVPCATGWYSSWGGWPQWCSNWGGPLRRYKTVPPANYVAPAKYEQFRDWRGAGRQLPPGFMASAHEPTGPTRGGLRRERTGDGGTPWIRDVGAQRPARDAGTRGASRMDPRASRDFDSDGGLRTGRTSWRGAQRPGRGEVADGAVEGGRPTRWHGQMPQRSTRVSDEPRIIRGGGSRPERGGDARGASKADGGRGDARGAPKGDGGGRGESRGSQASAPQKGGTSGAQSGGWGGKSSAGFGGFSGGSMGGFRGK